MLQQLAALLVLLLISSPRFGGAPFPEHPPGQKSPLLRAKGNQMNLPSMIKATTGHVFTLEDHYDASKPVRCYTLTLPPAIAEGRKVGTGYAGLDVFPDGIHALAVVHSAEESSDYSLGPFELKDPVELSLITAADTLIAQLKDEEVPLPPPA